VKVFSIFDSKAEIFWTPRFYLNAGVALRDFADAVTATKGDNALAQHPEDYTLFEIGNWDENGGDWIGYDAKIALGVGIEYVNREKAVLAAVPDSVSKVQGGE